MESETKILKQSSDNDFFGIFETIKIKKPIKSIIFVFMIYYLLLHKSEKNEIIQNRLEDIFPFSYNKTNEIYYAKLYFNICEAGTLLGPERYSFPKNPRISVIVPVYNRGNTLTRVLRSIQNQSFKNIEIIFVDDKSSDNSVELIESYQRKDKRIRLVKHEKNKGTFITRNDGALHARGEYITFIDPDDVFYEGILKKANGAANMYDTDIIRFDAFFRTNSMLVKYEYGNYFEKNKILYQPKIFKQTFYNYKGELQQHNLFLWGKIIKRKFFLEVLDNLTDYYKSQHWTLYEDNAMDFILLKFAKTYAYINENGYLYCFASNSSYSDKNKKSKANKTVKDAFLLAEISFDYTDDDTYEKQMAVFELKRLISEFKSSLEIVT